MQAVPSGPCAPSVAAGSCLRFAKSANTDSRPAVVRGGRGVAEFRAGSGISPKKCESRRGRLPNGTYAIRGRCTAYHGDAIKGYAIDLGSEGCNGGRGTNRTELFIHSGTTRSGGQGSLESRRWDGAGDYESPGCIKLSPNDVRKLFRNLNRNGRPATPRVAGG